MVTTKEYLKKYFPEKWQEKLDEKKGTQFLDFGFSEKEKIDIIENEIVDELLLDPACSPRFARPEKK